MIRSSLALPRFQPYLKSMIGKADSTRRVREARKYLGDLTALDRTLRKYALSKLRG